MDIPEREVHHSHDYHEYYVVLRGEATLNVNGAEVQLKPGVTVMVEPGEAHSVTWINPDAGCQWVLVKERSEPNSKKLEPLK